MIWTVIQTSLRRLKNNRSELLLTFVVPILFFSIFAMIFGARGSSTSGTPRIKVALANDSDSWVAKRASELLLEQHSLQFADQNRSVPRSKAEDWVRRGMVSAAIVFGPAASPAADTASESVQHSEAAQHSEKLPRIEVLSDSYDQVASQVMIALVQRAVMTAAAERNRDLAIKRQQQVTLASATVPESMSPFSNTPTPQEVAEPPSIQSVDILGKKKANPVIAMYAAGIAVMFLLFSATTASGSLLEERENSTLDRLLCSRLTMDQLLLGKWAFLTIIGMLQMTLMFSWGALVFGIDLARHWEGFIAMTLVTAGAAASFALFLASMCKTRTQLGWVSTIVILTMSALGGSMVPRYLMSESIQRVGLLTFNAWALEGFNKIFWRELHLRDIELELVVLTFCAFCFIVTARIFATRWERS
ncbi:MAG: ABC transporter permease [Planctomycetes bacterium]|nr:ABC transporter permease [Planctomycetota bacterium]